ncbi:nuclear export factor GLE1 [Arthrobacter pityocampae]|uniref:Nuclear export factor GLE1 n=1 Tax=Arthrobacter pityocampae TaxID=547334 RepID=A0A2S5J187_9MICC|nr:YcnI family protein [Arthrobacter pityocampae]PPB50557.1 nuclear export factor GLE1 [Arthrobacter pityocampae]
MTSFHRSRALTTGAVALATAGLMTVGLGAASAHVSVAPTSTTEDGYTQLTFSVPNESETAGTNKLEVQLPTEQPFTSVRVKPVEGWTAEVVTGALPEPATTADGATITEAPLSVVWTAEEGAEISQQEYQTFSLSVGRLPEAGSTVLLPTTQSYTDGEVSAWTQETVEGEEEPEKPAPSFVTTAAAEGEDAHGGSHGADAAATGEAVDTEQASTSTDATADTGSTTAVGWAGLAAGLLGLAAGVTALLRTRRRA